MVEIIEERLYGAQFKNESKGDFLHMTREEAKEVAKTMTYNRAILNVMVGQGIPYKIATKYKLKEMQELVLTEDEYKRAKALFFKNNNLRLHFSEIIFAGRIIDTMWECIERIRETRNYSI